MSSRGGSKGGRGGKAARGGNRYFAKADGAAADAKPEEVKSKKQKVVAAPVASADGKKGQKRKGGPEAETSAPKKEQTKKVAKVAVTEQVKKTVVVEQSRKQRKPKSERMGKRAWEVEEKVEETKEEVEEVASDEDDEDDSDVDSEASMPSDSEDSDFEQLVAKEGGSARYKAALALRDTFQNFRQEGAEDDDDDDDESEGEEKIQRRTEKLGDFVSLKSDSDDEDEDDEADKVVQKPESDEKKVTKGKQTKAKVEKSKQTEAKVEKGKQTKAKVEKKAATTTSTATKVKGKEPAAKKRRVKTGTMAQRLGAGAVYVGHLPYGFHKEQMMGFFAQFGRVLKISHPLSKKTGRSKGYAFVLFRHKEVAQVVADTMNGYLIYGRILRCKYIPASQLKWHVFKNAKTPYPEFNNQELEQQRRSTVRSAEKHKKLTKALVNKENKRRQKLTALGIDYDFPGYAAAVAQTKAQAE